MAYPVADSYSCASGGVIAGGLNRVGQTVALLGDSLTDDVFRIAPFYLANAIMGGKMKLLHNAGVGGESLGAMITRVENQWDAARPGLSGLGTLGRVFFRGGTNNITGGQSIATASPDYVTLLNAMAAKAQHVVILSVPPLVEDSGKNAKTIDYNNWLAAFAAANPSKFTYIDDSAVLRNPDGTQIASYFPDSVHFSREAVSLMAEVIVANLTLPGYPSPVSKDAADVYPAQPQWVTNPLVVGTSGTSGGGFSGQVANSFSVNGVGGGMSGACSKVAADGWDANQTPWQRITINTGSAASLVRIGTLLSGRAWTSNDPRRMDLIVECRFNGVDCSAVASIETYAQATSEYVAPRTYFDLRPTGTESRTYVLRSTRTRPGSTVPTTVTLYIDIIMRSTFAAPVGSIDIRGITLRG